jgi:hypothetical protein
MKLKTMIFSLLLASSAVMAGTPCEGKKTFRVGGVTKYTKSIKIFTDNGGNRSDILKVDSINTILTKFGSFPFPKKFEYNSENRAAYGYKFAVSTKCDLNVSSFLYKDKIDPSKNVHHHLVAAGDEAYTAGAIFFFHDGSKIDKVVISNRSSRFCPSVKSSDIVKEMLINMGIKKKQIKFFENTRCIRKK